jgi:hypothetical protein
LTSDLEATFLLLCEKVKRDDKLSDTHDDPFFTFVHSPGDTFELHRQLPRWRGILEREGHEVEILSLSRLCWDLVEASGRWDDWMEAEVPGAYRDANQSMRDVVRRKAAADGSRAGVLDALSVILRQRARPKLVLLTDAGLLHPWLRADKLSSTLHDAVRCPTVLFYPGRRRGPSLRFLDFYAEDAGSKRTTLLGGL